MTRFKCIPVPTEIAERFRATSVDDNGNTLRRVLASGTTGSPCRHCLRFALPGEVMLLGSYNLPRPQGIYWTPSPIFLHAEPCDRFDDANVLAPIVADGELVSLRSYDKADQCLYDLGYVGPGKEVAALLDRRLADPRTAFIMVHTARPGCMLTRIERASM